MNSRATTTHQTIGFRKKKRLRLRRKKSLELRVKSDRTGPLIYRSTWLGGHRSDLKGHYVSLAYFCYRRIVEHNEKAEARIEEDNEAQRSEDDSTEDDLKFSYENHELLLSRSGNKAAELYRDLKARYSVLFILIA